MEDRKSAQKGGDEDMEVELKRSLYTSTYQIASMTAGVASRARSVSRSQSTAPDVGLLAPIQPISVPRQPANESIVTASSFASQDTFMTAFTSHSPSSPTASKLNASSSSHKSLRKSISVDSFINSRRSLDLSEPGPSSSLYSDRPRESFDSDSGLDPDLEEWNTRPSYQVRNDGFSRPRAGKSFTSRILGRARGHSLSGHIVSDYDDPYLDDSEHERTTDMARLPAHRSPSATSSLQANGYGKGKARARPGDVLLLPPRTPTLSNASSVSSMSSATNGTTFSDAVPPVPPMPHPHIRRIPGPLVMPTRTRSGSLGANTGRSSWGSQSTDLSIAVVGPPGCGKTTVIRKGLKTWGISEESVCTVATPKGRLRYGSRSITIPLQNQGTRMTHILEVDSSAFCLSTPEGAWPEGLPQIDGVLVCYDASDLTSFARVPDLLACYHALHLSAVAMACKCDLEKKVPPHRASDRAGQYNVGLVEVTSMTDAGKKKMRSCFNWLLRAVTHAKSGDAPSGSPYRNPASPDVLTAPWADGFPDSRSVGLRSRVSTPSAGSPATTKFREHPLATSTQILSSAISGGTSTPTPRSPSAPTSPTRVKSMSDLLSEVERNRQGEGEREDGRGGMLGALARPASMSVGSLHETQETLVDDRLLENTMEVEGSGDRREDCSGKDNDPPPMPWATLEELLDKLFFLAVSGDDPTFIDHFFLTYRKFATPRSVLLGMQKRVRQLSLEHSDLLLGSYAQMRICDLLEEWTEEYPNDFATSGTSGALTALVKQIISNSRTLHYGADLLPFIEELPSLQDADASWSIKAEDQREESDEDDTGGLFEDGEEEALQRDGAAASKPFTTAPLADESSENKPKPLTTTRERKGSLPLSAKSAMMSTPLTTTLSGSSESSRSMTGKTGMGSPKASIKELVRVSQSLASFETIEIAEEITRLQTRLFLSIEPRQWLRYTMGSSRLDMENEPISGSASFYNRLSNWVSSLILAHDRVKGRLRQVERFAELAGQLRLLNNYAGLRAVMTGINNATFPNDEIMTTFRTNKQTTRQWKHYLGWEVLLNSTRNHRAYRLALKHTDGPGIPDMEVHTFDMVRAHDSNPNHKADDPTKIHWGKFTLMARMIYMLVSFQDKIRAHREYDFPERKQLHELLYIELMDEDTQRSRVIPPPDDAYEPPYHTTLGHDSPNVTRSDAARFKRLFFW